MGSAMIDVIDSHTAGEPTRVVVAGGPDLGTGSLAERRDRFREQFDRFRSAVVNEPRGSEVMVGALLCPPSDATCVTGVIFFNNVGYLGMCGHGMIGVMTTLDWQQRIQPGRHRVDTPVGVVETELHADGEVSVRNVPSYRQAKQVAIDVPEIGRVVGDVAWGGNWFFLVGDHPWALRLEDVSLLTRVTTAIRRALNAAGYPEVDHVELFGPPMSGGDSRNFVLCPGNAYDRSPCGTGTSAKLACLAADGKLQPGAVWVQESILGTRFAGRFVFESEANSDHARILPTVTGRAYVNAESRLIVADRDPFAWGIR